MKKFIMSSYIIAVASLGFLAVFGVLSTFVDGMDCLAGASFIAFVVGTVCGTIGAVIDMLREY